MEPVLPSQYPRDLSNCAVVATSIAAKIPYEQVADYFGRHRRGNWKGRVYEHEVIEALIYFGIPHVVHWDLNVPIYKIENMTRNNRSYIVHVRGHTFTYRSGYLIDQDGIRLVSKYRKPKRLVKKMIEVFT